MDGTHQIPNKTFSGLLFFLKGYRLLFTLGIFFQMINVTAGLLINLIIRDYTDSVIVDRTAQTSIWVYIGGFLALAIIQGITAFGGGRFKSRISEGITRDIRDRLFDHIQTLSFTFHDKMQTGELIQRVTSDVDSLNKFYGMQIVEIIRIVFLFILNWGMIMYLNIQLGLISIIMVPFIIGLSAYFFSRISKAFDAYQDQDARVSTTVQENLSGVRVVKAFARQEYEIEKFEIENREKLNLGKRFTMSHATYWPSSHILCSIQFISGIGLGVYLTFEGIISLGTFLAYTSMIGQITWPLQHLGRVIAQLSTAFVSYNRIAEILNEKPEDLKHGIGEEQEKLKGNIICKNLTFSYSDGSTALMDINFSCRAGEKIALVGEPGSGKTSFINLLPRFYDITGGDLTIDGKAIKKYSKHFLRGNIGIVEQQPFLFSATIEENIAYGVHHKLSSDEIINAAKQARIHHNIETFPQKYRTLVGEKGVTLSGGQKQRIAIARTILKNPAILILDDSTSAVDAETEQYIKLALNKLMEGRTTFVIAHRISSVIDADQILVFKDGQIVQHGNHESLIHTEGFYKTIFELQTSIEEEISYV